MLQKCIAHLGKECENLMLNDFQYRNSIFILTLYLFIIDLRKDNFFFQYHNGKILVY